MAVRLRVVQESGLFKGPWLDSTGYYEVVFARPGSILVLDEHSAITNGFVPVSSVESGSFYKIDAVNEQDTAIVKYLDQGKKPTASVTGAHTLSQTRRELGSGISFVSPPAWISATAVQVIPQQQQLSTTAVWMGLGAGLLAFGAALAFTGAARGPLPFGRVSGLGYARHGGRSRRRRRWRHGRLGAAEEEREHSRYAFLEVEEEEVPEERRRAAAEQEVRSRITVLEVEEEEVSPAEIERRRMAAEAEAQAEEEAARQEAARAAEHEAARAETAERAAAELATRLRQQREQRASRAVNVEDEARRAAAEADRIRREIVDQARREAEEEADRIRQEAYAPRAKRVKKAAEESAREVLEVKRGKKSLPAPRRHAALDEALQFARFVVADFMRRQTFAEVPVQEILELAEAAGFTYSRVPSIGGASGRRIVPLAFHGEAGTPATMAIEWEQQPSGRYRVRAAFV